jgi:hypothetical protein
VIIHELEMNNPFNSQDAETNVAICLHAKKTLRWFNAFSTMCGIMQTLLEYSNQILFKEMEKFPPERKLRFPRYLTLP